MTKKISIAFRVEPDLYPRVEAFAKSQFISVPAIVLQSLMKALEEYENRKIKVNYKLAKMTPGGLPGIVAPVGKKDTIKSKIAELRAKSDEEITDFLIKVGYLPSPGINEDNQWETYHILSAAPHPAEVGKKHYNEDGTTWIAKAGDMVSDRKGSIIRKYSLDPNEPSGHNPVPFYTNGLEDFETIINKLVERKLI